MKNFFLISAFLLYGSFLFGQGPNDPQDLNMDVNVTQVWTSVANIENTFNQARRQEETQLTLGTNAIANLDLPTQATWNGYSVDQKALYIMNDERTARAGINYGMGPVKGLPFNGIEANIDAVAQAWAQYNVDNNVFEHCHPTMANMDCPAGRISGAYPNNCTEFGGGIENLHANSSGTISLEDVLLEAIFGWNYRDAGSGWGHRHAMLAQDYNDDFGEAMQEGFVGFGIAQTQVMAVQWKTMVVVNFTNPVADAQAGACGYNVTVTTNSLTGPPCTTPPTINSVTKMDPPDCNNLTGSITINAVGNGALQYSNDGGANWQASNVFNNLMAGNYPVSVRLQAMTNCVTVYNQNPIVINAPAGCNGDCTEYPLTNLNLNIPDNDPNGVESIVNVPTGGSVTDINVKNLMATHDWTADLTFVLISPQGTMVTLIQSQCNSMDDFNISLDDAAANNITCPLSDGHTEKPQNPLSAFNGEDPMGFWKLKIIDGGEGDAGILNSWTLEVCVQGAPTEGYTCANAIEINAAGTYNAPGPNQGNGAIDGTHANWYKFTPPMTGMIRIFTCGLANGGDTHFHVYDDATVCPTTTDNVQYTEDRGCAAAPNDPSQGVDLDNIPVTAGIPIFIEWDDLGGNMAAFTWTLEYMTTGIPCTDYVATDAPKTILDNTPGGVTSTINVGTSGTIADVNIKEVKGNHTYLGALIFTLQSPTGTIVTLINQACDDNNTTTNFDLSLDDEAPTQNALPCPYNTGDTYIPQNPLSVFDGENPMGNWILNVSDNDGFNDTGSLTGWTLEICTQSGGPCPPILTKNEMNIVSGTYQAGNQLTSSGIIGAGNNVTFRAGNNIELQNNFTVSQTAVFEVKIGGCQ